MSDTHYFPCICPRGLFAPDRQTRPERASDSGSFGCCLAQTEAAGNKLTSAIKGVFLFLYMKDGGSVYGEV